MTDLKKFQFTYNFQHMSVSLTNLIMKNVLQKSSIRDRGFMQTGFELHPVYVLNLFPTLESKCMMSEK